MKCTHARRRLAEHRHAPNADRESREGGLGLQHKDEHGRPAVVCDSGHDAAYEDEDKDEGEWAREEGFDVEGY